MNFFGYALLIFLILFLLLLLTMCGRKNHPGIRRLYGFHYAHRGLHGSRVPENSMASFKAALIRGYGIELDVHLMKDGHLAVIHDASLKRTAGVDVNIEDLTLPELADYRLEGTEETIPTFEQVLELYAGKAPIIIELKPVKKNHAALAKAVCDVLKTYKGAYCIESFDPRCLLWLKKHKPGIIRGQLSQNFFKSKDKLSPVIKFLLTNNLLNFLTQPDFIAYRFEHRKTFSVAVCKKFWRMTCIGWTIKDPEMQKDVVKERWLSIFEGFKPQQ